jgi:hypothetical protein
MTAKRMRYLTGTDKPYFHDQPPLTGYHGTHLADVGQSASASQFCTLIWQVARRDADLNEAEAADASRVGSSAVIV